MECIFLTKIVQNIKLHFSTNDQAENLSLKAPGLEIGTVIYIKIFHLPYES